MDEKVFIKKEAAFMELDKQARLLMATTESTKENKAALNEMLHEMYDIYNELENLIPTKKQFDHMYHNLSYSPLNIVFNLQELKPEPRWPKKIMNKLPITSGSVKTFKEYNKEDS